MAKKKKKVEGKDLYSELDPQSTDKKVRRGPPNRMNDLSYTEWMKFQKSFYWATDISQIFTERVNFFTKRVREDGTPSHVALVSNRKWANEADSSGRKISLFSHKGKDEYLSSFLQSKIKDYEKEFDFIFIDLWGQDFSESSANQILASGLELSNTLRSLLKPEKYLAIMCPSTLKSKQSTYPFPWALAYSLRGSIRLKDEKIALDKKGSIVGYDLYFHAIDDEREKVILNLSKWQGKTSIKAGAPEWVIPKPPPRDKKLLEHPAKYPETLVELFIKKFSKKGDLIFDPMLGTGSTAVAAVTSDRNCLGIELQEDFASTARMRILKAQEKISNPLLNESSDVTAEVICGDSREVCKCRSLGEKRIDYLITSPPYWNMLRAKGSEGQRERRAKNLRLAYSEDNEDLGNIEDYDVFIDVLSDFYKQLNVVLKPGAFLTVIVKNMKKDRVIYPLAWDLAHKLRDTYEFSGYSLWCQDDVGMKPFALGILWVSNIVHHYCLHFRKPDNK